MTRRRRRIAIQSSSLFVLIVLNLLLLSGDSQQHQADYTAYEQQNLSYHEQHVAHPNQMSTTLLQSSQQHQQQHHNHNHHDSSQNVPSAAQLCAMLPVEAAKQMKLCKLIKHSPMYDEALTLGTSRGLAECRSQFKSERWNCTHSHGDHHLLTSQLTQSVGNKESGFVHAIAAAGIVHSIATACSVGNLSDCACDKTRVGLIRREEATWKWGGCSNNIRHGMLYAKHLVELLDAIHQHRMSSNNHKQHHHNQQYQHENHLNNELHALNKRSLSSRHREPNQERVRNQIQWSSPGDNNQALSFCQKNHNMSQATHLQLIKSLLAKDSLERHHEFRLAMNMHNNKVGRMAVAKNMQLRCRCHGLSGSCSLKTCWLTLPNFELIGAYLKKKYESSVHLPSAVNVNKLIPMMDRAEISAILSAQMPQSPRQQENQMPEFAPLVASPPPARGVLLPAGSSGQSNRTQLTPLAPADNIPQHFNYYERHRLLLQTAASNRQHPNSTAEERAPDQAGTETTLGNDKTDHVDETSPINVLPMSQQQYQALLKEIKLCNISHTATATPANKSHLMTRESSSSRLHYGEILQKKSHQHSLTTTSGRELKTANQHLSLVLHSSNRDDLIHLHKSPDYCEADSRHGFAGIKSRVCSDNPAAPDNCDKLCCGRGHTTRVYRHSYKCDCKFQYCCSIWCSVCEKEIKVLVCN